MIILNYFAPKTLNTLLCYLFNDTLVANIVTKIAIYELKNKKFL